MTAKHSYYDRLLVLALADRLSDDETVELKEHMRECLDCRRQTGELEVLHRNLCLWSMEDGRAERPPSGMRRRFIERAALSGVPLHDHTRRSSAGFVRQVAIAMSVLLALTLGWKVLPTKDHPYQSTLPTRAAVLPHPQRLGDVSRQPVRNEVAQTRDRVRSQRVRVSRVHTGPADFARGKIAQGIPLIDRTASDVFHPQLNFRQSLPAPDFISTSSKPDTANHPVFRCSTTLLSLALLNRGDSSAHNLIRTEFPITYAAGTWQLR